MLKIRLFRVGKKNQPAFKIVVTDKKNPPKSGRFVEEVGFWNPLIKQKVLKKDRIKYWLSVGAQPSETIHNLLVSEKIIEGEKITKHKKSKKKEPPSAPSAVETKESEKASAGKEEKPVKEPEAPKEEAPEQKEEVKEKEVKEEKTTEEKPAAEVKEEKEVKTEGVKEEKPEEKGA